MNWGSDGFSDGFCQKRREGRLKALTGKWNGRVCYRLIAGWGYPKSRLPPVVYRVFPLELVSPRISAGLRVADPRPFLWGSYSSVGTISGGSVVLVVPPSTRASLFVLSGSRVWPGSFRPNHSGATALALSLLSDIESFCLRRSAVVRLGNLRTRLSA